MRRRRGGCEPGLGHELKTGRLSGQEKICPLSGLKWPCFAALVTSEKCQKRNYAPMRLRQITPIGLEGP